MGASLSEKRWSFEVRLLTFDDFVKNSAIVAISAIVASCSIHLNHLT